jgi:hypothetical protein
MNDPRGLLTGLIGDGRPLLSLTAIALFFAGAFAVFLSATGQFLPHDTDFLQLSARDLCAYADCQIVAFMFHDRVAFGGSLLAVAVLYLWLSAFPLREGEAWAWWTFAISGSLGFLSFLAYLAYGYLDTWHGIGTLFLMPCFVLGLVRSRETLSEPRGLASIRIAATRNTGPGTARAGRMILLATAGGMILAGATILVVGMTAVFVPQDLAFMGLDRDAVLAIHPRLIPLIAHDRAGFGGGLASAGIVVGMCVYCGRPSVSLWQALLLAGIAGFGCAIGVHYRVGYTDPGHLGPALAGAAMFAAGITLTYRSMVHPTS